MMTTEMIGVAALVLLVYRAIEVLARANMKQRLMRGDVGNTVEVDADKATEAWEKKALGRAKTGGGFVRMPYNERGVTTKTCYVRPLGKHYDRVTLQCEGSK